MSKFFSKRRFHSSSPANLIPSNFFNYNNNNNNSSKSSPESCRSSANGGLYSPQLKKRLTRQRKLRYVSAEEYSAPEEGDGVRSKSLPHTPVSDSVILESPSPSPQLPEHWSVFAVPQRLPLPIDELRLQAEGGNDRSDRIKTKGRGVPVSPKTSTYHRRRGRPQDNGEKVHDDIRLDVPARSAPSTTLTSPTLSPKRFSTVDIFDSAFTIPQECHLSTTSRRGCQLHSPPLQSPYLNCKTETNNANVHPLPLPLPPPPAPAPSKPVSHRQSFDKPDGQPIKGQWQKGKLLGRGTFGTVYEATNRETGSLCALKEVDVICDDPKSSECVRQLEQEIRVLKNLEHPNIVQYMGSEVVEDRFCIYLEYVHPGPINKYIREHCAAVTESVIRNFTRHILSGLAYLHSKKTVHRDIKGANLLVDAYGVVKLADFGLAKHLSAHVTDLSLKGSPHWMAPEVLQAVMRKDSNPEHTFTMDIWSLGCTVIEMVTGKPPWSEFNGVQAMFNVLHRSPPIPETLSAEGKDFLNRCLQRNPENRSSAAMLLEHPFVCNSFDHNISLCKQEFSSLRLNEIFHNPRDSPAHPKDTAQSSQCTLPKRGRLQFKCGTPKQPYSETKTSKATRLSPRSTLDASDVNFRTHHYGISQVHSRLPSTSVGARTYSLPTTPSRETYLF
uniref:mitogen-activated protein kinase kinase kinase 5-like isoform X2 n=1 Tax=Erigeron canadensis TaxID=72917 RepID=UPI001CB890EE|nr:mitogen-activated protein kinase kinase kinase 5-like isoform X2 [Erigeron canadensis]